MRKLLPELPGIKLIVPAVFLLSVFFVQQSCKKMDLKTEQAMQDPVEKFFTIPTGTDPAVKRVVENLQQQNKLTGFINTLALKEGYAVWDKAIVKIRHGSNSFAGNNDDTIACIPLVLTNTNYVNSFIYAKMNGSVSLNLFRGKEYANLGFDTTTEVNAHRMVNQLLELEYITFGHTKFRINDDRLFKPQVPEYNSGTTVSFRDNINSASNYTGMQLVCVTHTGPCNGNPFSANPANVLAKPSYPQICTNTICDYVLVTLEDGPDFPGSTGPGDPGGGGTGGNGIPGPTECPTTIFDGQMPPECGSNTQLPVIILEEDTPPRPCDYINQLVAKPTFQAMVNKLRDSCAINNYETVALIKNPLSANASLEFKMPPPALTGQQLITDITYSGTRDVVAHNHNNDPKRLSIFTVEDLAKLYKLIDKGKVSNLSNFTFVLVTNQTSYILMITDTYSFQMFANNWLKSRKLLGNFSKFMYQDLIPTYRLHEDSTNYTNEKNFLYNLKHSPGPNSAPSGFLLFRGNSNMTHFDPITVDDATRNIVPAPCP